MNKCWLKQSLYLLQPFGWHTLSLRNLEYDIADARLMRDRLLMLDGGPLLRMDRGCEHAQKDQLILVHQTNQQGGQAFVTRLVLD